MMSRVAMHAHDLELVSNVSSDPRREEPSQGQATVVGVRVGLGAETWTLALAEGGERQAKRAASCLLEPAIGDRVWYVDGSGSCYVIAVLERDASAGPAKLRVEGDAQLRVDGQLELSGAAGLELRSDARVSVQADELQVRARLGKVLLDECSSILRSSFAHVGKSTFVGTVFESFIERFSAHNKTSVRTIEDVDKVQAGNIDYRAEHVVHLGAEHAVIKAGELAKVDAGQIHLG
jgi:hypothetical protein